MKEAMWGLGFIMVCLLVFVIVGVISNVSLTNQQDYYGVKQSTEAAAYDAVKMVDYKSGVCICTNKTNSTGATVFTSKLEYELEPVVPETGECDHAANYSQCELLLGEYVIDPDTFTESVIARLGSIVKPSEVYDITVQEVIKYPPKVSVNIDYKQALNLEGEDRIHQVVPNQFDGIFEETGAASILTYAKNEIADWQLSCTKPEDDATIDSTPDSSTESTTTKDSCESTGTSCKWKYDNVSVTCKREGWGWFSPKKSGEKVEPPPTQINVTVPAAGNYNSCGQAYSTCQMEAQKLCSAQNRDGYHYVYQSGCYGKQSYGITYNDNSKEIKTRICYNSATPDGVCDMTKMKSCMCCD